ncbi:MAG: hypothetical protein KGL39_18485 [Patescibacteria group bacterium]|nr:hypothetical protein [Patescibacteria group bacterium]
MSLQRAQHWATRALHHFLIERAKTSFAWGTHDCALFAADGILAMTGVDIAADFRGKYHDEASAFALIRQLTGGSTVADAAAWCAKKSGMPEWKFPLLAQRGDLVVLEESGRLIAGLVHLSGRHLVCAGENGLHRLPVTDIRRAWHAGPKGPRHV